MLSMLAYALLLWIVPTVVFSIEVDHCLDTGGSYDYDQCQCDYQLTHSFKALHECN